MESDKPVSLGWLAAKVDTLEAEVREIRAEVTAIRTRLDIQKGGWLMLVALTSAAATLGAGIMGFFEWWTRK